MATDSSRFQDNAEDDELDDILNSIVEGRDIDSGNNNQTQPRFQISASKTAGDGLGIDEEIIVTKKRIPIPKLDDHRLLSDPGIPRLRKISKDRLRFKGKGHEYGDIARMLNMYQLWLDDLYPRAKFADALTIIEKVGHTKRMQIMRKDWIDEGKPRRTVADDEDVDEITPDQTSARQGSVSMEGIEQEAGTTATRPDHGNSGMRSGSNEPMDAAVDGPDEDELDMLLAESEQPSVSTTTALPSRTVQQGVDDPFADEMEAMADMEDMW